MSKSATEQDTNNANCPKIYFTRYSYLDMVKLMIFFRNEPPITVIACVFIGFNTNYYTYSLEFYLSLMDPIIYSPVVL